MTTININGSSNPSNAAATHYADAHHKISPGAKVSDKSLPAEISADAVDNGVSASSDASSSSVGASFGEESFSCNGETVADDGNAMVSAANAREEDMATNQLDVEDMATNQPNIEEISLESIYQCSDILKLRDIYGKLLENENASSHLTNEAKEKLIELHLLRKAADAAGAEQLATDDPSFTLQEPRHNTAKDAIPVDPSGSSIQEEESSQKEPVWWCLQDSFIDHKGWQEAKSTAKKFSEGCEYITGDVLPGDSHASDASEIKVVVLKSFPVPGLERVMQKNVTKDGLENTSLDQIFGNIVTRLKEDDGFGMSHDKAVDLAFGHIAFIDAIAAVCDWDLRSDKHKKKHFKKLTEELGLRELMRVIIIDVLKMLPNLEKIYAMGAEGFIMLDLIRSDFPDQITQEDTIMHGMQLSNGWVNEDQATRYLDVIDEIAAILSGKDAKGFKNREHKEKYVTIGKDRNVRFSIRSIKNDTPLGIARSLAMIAEWTSTDIETIRRSLKRNDGILSLHGIPLYRLTIVSNDLAVGKTDEGVAAFERRKQEVYGTNSRAREQEVISILSIEDSTPLGTTHSLEKAAEWTGVSEPTFQKSLERNDGILTLNGKPLYRIAKGKVNDGDDEVSFGMTVAGSAQFKRRKNGAKGYRICSSDGKIVFGIARTITQGAEWTGVHVTTFGRRLNSEDRFLNLNGKPLYQLSNCIVEATDEVSFGMTEEGKAQFKRRKQEVNAAKQGGYRICSSDGSIVYGIARTMPEGAEWTGTSEPTFRRRLNSEDRFLNVKGGARYQLSNCVVEATDEVSFGMTEEGKAQFKRRKQEVKKQKSKKKRSFNTLDPSAILDTDSSGRKRVKTQDDSDGGLASKLDSSEKDEATSDVNERLVSITKSLISLKEKGTGRKLSEIFSEKPCHTTYPDYYQLIEKPIGMNDILRKCRAKLYSSVTEFRDDWNTLFTNCVTYNGEGTWITIDAGVLKAEFNRLMDKNKEVTQARNCP